MLSNKSGPQHRDNDSSATGARGPVLRALLLVAVLAAWLAVAAFGGMAQGSLSEVQENDQAAFLPSSAESTRADDLAEDFVTEESLPALIVIEADDGGTLDEQDLAVAEDLAAQVPERELRDGQLLGDVLTGPVAAVPAEDGEALLLPVPVDAELSDEQLGDTGERTVNAVITELRALVDETLPDAGLTGWVTGPAGFVADLSGAFGGIDSVLLIVALVVVFVILVLVYRSPILPFTVLLTAVFALCAAALVVKPLAGNGVLLLNGQSQGILSILVIGAATDYSLLVVARYREELGRHAEPRHAMAAAVRASLGPILASAGTVIVGLLCLLLSDLGSNASLGPVGSIGIASAVISALTLLPALLLIAGRRSRALFWPRIPSYERDAQARAEADPATTGVWARVAGVVGRRPRAVWVSVALGLAALAAFAPTFQASGTGESEVFLGQTESVEGEEVLVEHFDAGQVQPVLVITAEASAEEVLDAVLAVDGVDDALITVDPESEEPLVVDGRVQIEASTTDPSESQAATVTAGDIRDAVRDVDAEALVGGAAAQRLDTQQTARQDLVTIIPLVLAAIFIMLVVLLRAVLAPLVILLVNVLSFAATLGLSAIFFNHVFGFPGADASVPLFGFVFLVALSIDYSIFLMTRVREETLEHGTRRGVLRGLAVTGGVITSAGLVLAATFSALVVIPLLFLVQLAFIVAVGVLVDTFIVRSLLLPGIVYDIGRPVWWPWLGRVPRDEEDAPAGTTTATSPARGSR